MTYARYPLIYGLSTGAVIAATISAGLAVRHHLTFFAEQWFGYLVMLVAMTFVFVGVKRYRDVEKGGVIKFLPALGMGVSIAVVAAIAYVLVWEIYLWLSGYTFMEEMIAEQLAKLKAQGVTGAELAQHQAYFEWGREIYRNPPARIGITMLEILPVGLLVALASALALMFPKVLPGTPLPPAGEGGSPEGAEG
jgi:hypothetical protein